ncbi:MAG: DUF3726 domain-containing protein [Alphaproteobacteria bacterium]|nr:DUF3726 domain-containing protein [Alphaproteobacteria bacterium]
MHVSLNEIATTVERAARGAGATAGVDTEAGAAATWLEARGLPALDPLAAALKHGPARGLVLDDGRVALADASCAFHAGTLIDLAVARLRSGAGGLKVTDARDPLFLVAAAERFARTGLALTIAWDGAEVRFDAAGALALHGAVLVPASDVNVDVRVAGPPPRAAATLAATALDRRWRDAIARGVDVDPATWTRLRDFARRTYVPASALSRSRGAGAEVDDSA